MSIVYLKIKIKSLAAEARMIRQQELKTHTHHKDGSLDAKNIELRDSLALHRRWDVRNECRAAHIAYGFLRGRSYRQIEPSTHTDAFTMAKIVQRAEAIARKYGQVGSTGNFSEWLAATVVVEAEERSTVEAAIA